MWKRLLIALALLLAQPSAWGGALSSVALEVATADVLPNRAENDVLLKRPPLRNLDEVIASGHINIGLYEDFPPYAYREEDGSARGVDVEIGHAIAEGLGLEFRPFWIKPASSLGRDLGNTISRGHYLRPTQVADVMLRVPYDRNFAYMRDSTGEYINKSVVMFGPYQREQWDIAFDSAQLDDAVTLGSFRQRPIGAEYRTLPATYLTAAMGGQLRDNVRHYRDAGDAFAAMARGEIAGVMAIRGELEHFVSHYPEHDFRLADATFPGISRQQWDIGMAVRHNHRQLGYAVEAIVDRAVRDGTLGDIFQAHALEYRMPDFYEEILGADND
ncbi:transporter substrate-binding domain-containing protein [Halomonas campisalis]|uniref:Transporter substrate-binding domain-containing protein n=1 Tax=Billgrantia campisalis TaxID=74661 RepID=A0ABS9P8T1_9GAMM|nr:transporter substrate-binding domain-containing protein [Halomonas campisalis]MCG6658183.1 transporter substrate-binding domain-containing protein [Halomonas campisalis]MDR5862851.1 transporter substrate-binding domain-containing protein [Halomonas campisalis]